MTSSRGGRPAPYKELTAGFILLSGGSAPRLCLLSEPIQILLWTLWHPPRTIHIFTWRNTSSKRLSYAVKRSHNYSPLLSPKVGRGRHFRFSCENDTKLPVWLDFNSTIFKSAMPQISQNPLEKHLSVSTFVLVWRFCELSRVFAVDWMSKHPRRTCNGVRLLVKGSCSVTFPLKHSQRGGRRREPGCFSHLSPRWELPAVPGFLSGEP